MQDLTPVFGRPISLPPFDADDLTRIILILLRIEAELDLLLEEDDGEEEDRP